MALYRVTMYQTLVDSDIFEADSEEEAIEMANMELDPEDISDVDFEVETPSDEEIAEWENGYEDDEEDDEDED